MSHHSLLLLAFGQSNADLYPAKPALECEAFGDPRIVTFNDGNGFRGLLGQLPRHPVTDLTPAQAEGQAHKKTRDYQSFQLAAAARLLRETDDDDLRQVVIRAEGRGGRRFSGIVSKDGREVEGIMTNVDGSDSQILLNGLETIRISAELARQKGAPLSRVIVNFLHGEADRGLSRAEYAAFLEQIVSRFDEELADLGLPIDWLILDPAGTSTKGSGNAWACRLGMADVAARHPNVRIIGTGAAYPLDDTIHYSSEARALFGEHFGAAAAQLLAMGQGGDAGLGWALEAPRIARARLTGNVVDLELSGDRDFELVRGVSDDQLTVEGFNVTHLSRCMIETVEQTGPRSLRVTLDGPPVLREKSVLNYAFRLLYRDDPRGASPYPAGRGGWRSVEALDSMVLPGRRIHQWVPGFSIRFDEMEQG